MGAMKQKHIEDVNRVIDRLNALVAAARELGFNAEWHELEEDGSLFRLTVNVHPFQQQHYHAVPSAEWRAWRAAMLDKPQRDVPENPDDIPF